MTAGPTLRGRRGRDRHVAEAFGRLPAKGARRPASAADPAAPGPGRRQPDLSALPPAPPHPARPARPPPLAAPVSSASLRERLGSVETDRPTTARRAGRHV